tara:strand:- start:484 stop:783 length:300 start_codon:yes stop_codon:yes gene_type:complete
MCSNCGYPEVKNYWADLPASHKFNTLRSKLERVKKLKVVLGQYGLSCDDDGTGFNIQVSNKVGRTELVRDLENLWEQVESMLGQPVDPLDIRFYDKKTV